MNNCVFLSLFRIFLLLGITNIQAGIPEIKKDSLQLLIRQMEVSVNSIYRKYDRELLFLRHQNSLIEDSLQRIESPVEFVQLMKLKQKLENKISTALTDEQNEITKVRYIKGLQVIKILYEKTLALDHHFSSVSSLHEINKISNPNQYPEFLKVKSMLLQSKDRKTGFDLGPLLGQNIYTSVIHSMVSLFTNTHSDKSEKEAELKKVECILDFTLRMHQDLNTIYFETVFLQKSNDDIMDDLNQLFANFTKPISYSKALDVCRDTDDWDQVRFHLNDYLISLEEISKVEENKRKARRMVIDIEFSIDRLLYFISRYNAFIDQGSKFYEKFGIMLNSYENESTCSEQIPREYLKLKESIQIATDKFNTAYKPVEINGSKMKEILYGINEYD